MEVISKISEIKAVIKKKKLLGNRVGFVPTMGFLHDGHLSLVRRARKENDRVGVSLFVNPRQFNNPEDLEKYPRDMERDISLLEKDGVDLVWAPTSEMMYPPGYQTFVDVHHVTMFLEGASRPVPS